MLKDKDLKDIQALISLGKQRGYVTYEEMNTLLPEHLVAADQLDDVMIMFTQLDIEVLREPRSEQSDEPAERQQPLQMDTPGFFDSVRPYLRKMGRVSLSHKGEIEIARRIEEGEKIVNQNVLTSATAVAAIQTLIESDNDHAQRTRDGRTYLEVQQLAGELLALLESNREKERRARSKTRREESSQEVTASTQSLLEVMQSLGLSQGRIEDIAQQVQDSWSLMQKHESGIAAIAQEAGVPVRDLRRIIRKVRQTPEEDDDTVLAETGLARETWADLDIRIRRELRRIRKVEMTTGMDRGSLRTLAREVRRGKMVAEMARAELVDWHAESIAGIARQHTRQGLSTPDLFQALQSGLLQAIGNFEYRRGYRFWAHAESGAHRSLQQALADSVQTLHLPQPMIDAINTMLRARHIISSEAEGEPTPADIADRMGVTVDRVQELLALEEGALCLVRAGGDPPVSPTDHETEDGDTLYRAANDWSSTEFENRSLTMCRQRTAVFGWAEAQHEFHREAIAQQEQLVAEYRGVHDLDAKDAEAKKERADNNRKMLATLAPREERVLRQRFGIEEEADHTGEKVGQDFEATREKIRRIEMKALRKLRHPGRASRLRSFIEADPTPGEGEE